MWVLFLGRNKILFFAFALGIFTVNAQEKHGLVVDNYLPIHQNLINPALMANPKVWLDINLVGAHAFVGNNYIYAPQTTYTGLAEVENVLTNSNPNNLRLHAHSIIMGPSASLAILRNTYGLQTNVKTFLNVDRIPGALMRSIVGEDTLETGRSYTFSGARLKGMSWMEVGLSFAQINRTAGKSMITVGGSLKYLRGLGIMNVIVTQGSYTHDGADEVKSSGKYARVAELNSNAGLGFSTDIGFTIQKTLTSADGYVPHSREGGCRYIFYKYRLGVSLMDFGFLRFNRGAEYGEWNQEISLEDLDGLLGSDTVSTIFENEKQTFVTMLPSALSVQFDYYLVKNFYLNASIFQSIGLSNTLGVERGNSLYASLRYEHRYFAITLPVTLYNYSKPSIGLALRLGPLNIGTDVFTPLLLKSDIYKADIYASIHIKFRRNPACKGKKQRNDGSGQISCPTW